MKFSLKSLLSAVRRGDMNIREAIATGVSSKIEEQKNLSISDRLKSSKASG